ncbi:MAG: dihydroorotate dehydrogenase-like protein [Microthrixaceae bacterium]
MTDLTTSYLGLSLKHPVLASASPLTGSVESLLELESAGAAAVVLPSLFEEQIEADLALIHHPGDGGSNPEAHGGYLPDAADHPTALDHALDLLGAAKDQLRIPVIASLNGDSDGGWATYAAALEGGGADALELNIYLVAADPTVSGSDVERAYLRLVEHVRAAVSVPLAVKVGPQFSSPANMARRLADAGADALVLFNRFYQPDIDLETMSVRPDLVLSTSADLRLTLRWIAVMAGRVDAALAATGGAHTADDVVKLLLAGADVAMMAAALLKRGPEHLHDVVEGVQRWFDERDYRSLDEARGSVSQVSVADPAAYERANYLKTLASYRPGTSSDA